MRNQKFLIPVLCCILLFSACARLPVSGNKLPETYTVGVICTNGSKDHSSILYFDENLDQTGVTYYPYATMGEIFYCPVTYDGAVYLVPQGQANRKNEKTILQQDLATLEQRTYSLDQIAIYGLSVSSSAIYAANNLNSQSFVSRIDRTGADVRTVSFDNIYISIVYSYKNKLYAFSSQSTDSGTKGTLHCLDPVTLEELQRIDISGLGNAVYSVTGVEDTLYFVPAETSQGTFNHIVGAYNISTGEISAIELPEAAYHIRNVDDRLYITHGNLVTGEGTELSVYEISTGQVSTYDLGIWTGQITVRDNALYVMGAEEIATFDIQTMEKQAETKIPLESGYYLSGIFSY